MALPTWYDTGTVSVANGSALVTGTGTLWAGDAIMPGDLFCDLAQPLVPPQRIASVEANGELTLAAPWPGTSLTDDAYEIRYVGIIERSTAQTRRVLEELGEVTAWADIMVESDADRLALETPTSPLRANYRVLVADVGTIWAKATSAYEDWIGPVEFKGDTGETGAIGPRGVTPKGNYSDATAYVEGDAVLDNGSTWVALVSTTGNAPPVLPTESNSWWHLLARKGTDGTGTGDVVGPASSVANRVAKFSGTTGKLLADGGAAIQTSTTDTTPGSLMGVGAFGVGKALNLVSPDLSAVRAAGLYYCNSPTNGPGGNGWLRVYDLDADYAYHEFTSVTTGVVWSNRRFAGAWTGWVRLVPAKVSFSASKGGTDQTGFGTAKITFTSEIFDVGGFYDAPNSRFLPEAGKYRLSGRVLIAGTIADGTSYTLAIYKNGVQWIANQARASGSSGFSVFVSGVVDSNGTDYWELYFYTGGSATTINGQFAYTAFDGEAV